MDLTLPRRVTPELLDGLPADDPRAKRSREDLPRIHRAMATLSIANRALDRGTVGFMPRTLLELGAGDGALMLRLAQHRQKHWPDVRVTLLDRLPLVAPRTLEGLTQVGWTPNVVVLDVFEWLASPDTTCWDVILANLFLHHFSDAALRSLLRGVAARSRVFVCCEPRRSMLALAGSHVIGVLGVGPVTRQDAVSSVHAGFRGRELSDLWPDPQDWNLTEQPAGLFTHCFFAFRKGR